MDPFNCNIKCRSSLLYKLNPFVGIYSSFMDTCCQFHRHFTSSFCTDILSPKNYKANQNVSREKLHTVLTYEKGPCKMLMKLTPVENLCPLVCGIWGVTAQESTCAAFVCLPEVLYIFKWCIVTDPFPWILTWERDTLNFLYSKSCWSRLSFINKYTSVLEGTLAGFFLIALALESGSLELCLGNLSENFNGWCFRLTCIVITVKYHYRPLKGYSSCILLSFRCLNDFDSLDCISTNFFQCFYFDHWAEAFLPLPRVTHLHLLTF